MNEQNKMKPIVLEAEASQAAKQAGANRTGIIIPRDNTIVYGYGRHNASILYYVNLLNEQRKARGQPELTTEEKNKLLMEDCACLVFAGNCIGIRPPANMKNIDVVIDSDEILQQSGVPRHKIRFLHASNPMLSRAMLRRGGWWRLAQPPITEEGIEKLFADAKRNLSSNAVYWYNMETGTRWLTYDGFRRLGELKGHELADCLREIAVYSNSANAQKMPEIDFFMADKNKLDPDKLSVLKDTGDDDAWAVHNMLSKMFKVAVAKDYQEDNEKKPEWRKAMVLTLTGHGKREFDEMPKDSLLNLSPEYSMRVRWLPGAKIQDGVLVRDPIYDTIKKDAGDCNLEELCRTHGNIVMGIIEDKFRENPRKILSANVGCVISSLSEREKSKKSDANEKIDAILERRGVYLLVMEERGKRKLRERLIRMQKRDVATFLDEGLNLGEAHLRAGQYTQYITDRNLACRELGMEILPITTGSVVEVYDGQNSEYKGTKITATYFERDYVHGIATSKIPAERFADIKFIKSFFYQLGWQAALNIAPGRVNRKGKVLFDDGDEVLVNDKIIISDMTGSFRDYQSSLESFIPAYALPVIKRKEVLLGHAGEARDCYVNGFLDSMLSLQQHYYCKQESMENFRFKSAGNYDEFDLQKRWAPILRRFGSADANLLAQKIREEINAGTSKHL